MSQRVEIRRPEGARTVSPDELPLSVGGAATSVPLPGVAVDGPVAHIGEENGELFVQPIAGAGSVRCNGMPIAASVWLHPEDSLEIGDGLIVVSKEGPSIVLTVSVSDPVGSTESAEATIPESAPHSVRANEIITPVPFTPSAASSSPRRSWRPHPITIAAWILVAAAVAVLWFVLSTSAVTIEITPTPESVELSGGLIRPRVAGRFLLRAGTYRLVAEHPEYRRLERELTVKANTNQIYRFTLDPRPGTLSVHTVGLTGAVVELNGQPIGMTPLNGAEVAIGEHQVVVRAERYRVYESSVIIDRPGEVRHLSVELVPAWAAVTFRSRPKGARVLVDGTVLGATPLTVDLGAGAHRLELRLEGFKAHTSRLEIVANEPRTLPVVDLEPADAVLDLECRPTGATVTVDGRFAGQCPQPLALAPGSDHEISVSKTGHRTQTLTVRLGAGTRQARTVDLEPLYGELQILSTPSDAEIFIDGTPQGRTAATIRLPAVKHTVELRKEGYRPYTATVVPEEGLLETLRADLEPKPDPPTGGAPAITTSQGIRLVRVAPGGIRMGASRREPGRRANEAIRDVEVTRPYYLAVHEVTNAQFLQFSPQHRSGDVAGISLRGDDHPVVNVTWEDAIRFCNWLSEREGLPPVYVEHDGTWVARLPFPDGYRLPTEAEWALAARAPDGDPPRKYVWGDELPLPAGAGNYGDSAAGRILDGTLPDYADGHAATAPVGSFAANPLGVFDLGGNVAEWVHDAYTIHSPQSPGSDRDPTGPVKGEYHVIRGAGWMDGKLTRLRLSYRDYGKDAAPDVGFRIARNAR